MREIGDVTTQCTEDPRSSDTMSSKPQWKFRTSSGTPRLTRHGGGHGADLPVATTTDAQGRQDEQSGPVPPTPLGPRSHPSHGPKPPATQLQIFSHSEACIQT